ncbi:MAG TPA: hypothetical protein DCO75_09220 [Fibrobacteres bacterium]|jgi:hypothetical protein|nr:hypothetical protein [Fibrobacterota bacterium]
MKYWIKRIAGMLSTGAFFIGFFMSIDPVDPFNATIFIVALLKGAVGAIFFWALGFVIADIVIKGLVTGIHTDANDTVEGGLLQRIYSAQATATPGTHTAGNVPVLKINSIKKDKTGQND